jgi:multimeric flavodoxin WrbA
MMNKILIIVGSPRMGGNTDLLVRRLAEGAASKGAQVDTIWLAGLNIRECDGCHVCWKGRHCSKDDDMLNIYRKIIDSDAIVFGTPVYWYGPTALMKALIDRFVYFNCPDNRARIRGKKACLAIPFEEENPETARPVVEFFEKSLGYLEMNLIGGIIVGGVSARGDILKKQDRLNEAYELGKRLAQDSETARL